MTPAHPGAVGIADRDVPDVVAAAVRTVDGLTLLVPLRAHALRWAEQDAALAITLDQDTIEIRLVAHRLPLPPQLDQLTAAVRAALSGTSWHHARLRLIVAELTTHALKPP